MTLIDDEGIRSLVALEMKLSGNLITPTMHGDYYYYKPPLFNWILLLFFQLTGSITELTARIPTTFFLFIYAATIYYFFRKHFDVKTSFITALVFVSCGRIMYWDSMLALIDICFSWVTFLSFMVIYHQFKKENWWALFLISYILTAAGFLLKGLPSIVFQGFTLLAYFIYKKEFKRLFSIQHILSGLLFLAIIGLYYWIYSQYNSLESIWQSLFSESSKRTALKFGLSKTILHFFAFPFEMIYHFLPWSLMIIYFFKKGIHKVILQNEFITYCLLIFLANIIVYWTSPEVFPRYLLMLAPLIFATFIYLHKYHQKEGTIHFKIIEASFLVLCVLVALASWSPLFLEQTQFIPFLELKTILIGLSLLAICYLYWIKKMDRILAVILFLIVFRIGFNWYILPARNAEDYGDLCRQSSIIAGREFKEQKLYVYKYTLMQPTNSFYLTRERGEIIPRKLHNFEKDALYIIDPQRYPFAKYDKVGSFEVRHGKLTYDIGYLK